MRGFRFATGGPVLGMALVLVGGSLPPGVGAQTASAAALEEMVRTERRFSARSAEAGMRRAFLEFFSDSVVLFRPGPVVGRSVVRDAPDLDGTLTWAPAVAEMARSGDLGYTSGPYRIVRGGEVVASGHYLTLWSRSGPEEPFRAVLDVGVPHEPAARAGEEVERPPAPEPVGPSPDRPRESLLETEDALEERYLREGRTSAYERYALPRLRFYRSGTPPLQGREQAVEWLVRSDERMEWRPAGVRISASAELGYVYGTVTLVPDGGGTEPREGSYVRIWRRKEGRWRMVMEVVTPHV